MGGIKLVVDLRLQYVPKSWDDLILVQPDLNAEIPNRLFGSFL